MRKARSVSSTFSRVSLSAQLFSPFATSWCVIPWWNYRLNHSLCLQAHLCTFNGLVSPVNLFEPGRPTFEPTLISGVPGNFVVRYLSLYGNPNSMGNLTRRSRIYLFIMKYQSKSRNPNQPLEKTMKKHFKQQHYLRVFSHRVYCKRIQE